MEHTNDTNDRNALGSALSRNWVATVAVIWCGQAASVLATCAASFAALWYITESTASPLWLSLASAAALLPAALLSPLGGVAADRFKRKYIMIIADGAAGALSLAFALVIFAGQASILLMLLILVARASAQAFHSPAFSALMPSLVPERHLVRINSMDQAVTSLSSIAGPALGILLYNLVGLGGVMVLDAACAAFACLCLGIARVSPQATGTAASSTVLGDLREGITVIMRDAGLRNLMLLVMATMLLFMPAGSLTPLMTYQHFGGDGWQASIVEATFGAGLLVGSAFMAVWGRRQAARCGAGGFRGRARSGDRGMRSARARHVSRICCAHGHRRSRDGMLQRATARHLADACARKRPRPRHGHLSHWIDACRAGGACGLGGSCRASRHLHVVHHLRRADHRMLRSGPCQQEHPLP